MFLTIPLGLLSHYGFRFEAQKESAAAGYGDKAKGGRLGQDKGNIRHIDDVLTTWFGRMEGIRRCVLDL